MRKSIKNATLKSARFVKTWPVLAAAILLGGTAHGDDQSLGRVSSERGAALYVQHCSICHDHPTGRIPPVFILNYKSAEQIVLALTQGPMRQQAAGLSADDVRQIAIHLSGHAPGMSPEVDPGANRCAPDGHAVHPAPAEWNGLNGNPSNSRFQPEPGITASDVPRLKLKWAFTYPGGIAYTICRDAKRADCEKPAPEYLEFGDADSGKRPRRAHFTGDWSEIGRRLRR